MKTKEEIQEKYKNVEKRILNHLKTHSQSKLVDVSELQTLRWVLGESESGWQEINENDK